MKYFKLVTSNKDGSFVIGEDEIPKLMAAVNGGTAAVFREGILLNPSMCVSVVVAVDRMDAVHEQLKYGSKYDAPSPFAKILAGKMGVSPQLRTAAQEEAGRLGHGGGK